ncbi:MAG: hypothetical protein HY290_02870 [Planctomycetia bacterium]|nr:hypothetical protein [Planctomycetia bacterium]
MNGTSSRMIRLAGCALLLAGCRNTQLPSFAASNVAAERRSFAYHDPSPDIEAGPWVERQRGFERARAEPRRVYEKEVITNDLLRSEGAPVTNNSSASRYPASVSP